MDNEYCIGFFFFSFHADAVMQLYKKFTFINCTFIGAGFCSYNKESGFEINFYSDTCKKKFGYDSPKTKEERDVIVENIKKLLENLF